MTKSRMEKINMNAKMICICRRRSTGAWFTALLREGIWILDGDATAAKRPDARRIMIGRGLDGEK